MVDTYDKQEITGSWTDINALTGIAVGTALIIQNVGAKNGAMANIGTPNAIVELTTNSSTPNALFTGWHVEENQTWAISAGEPKVWARYTRLGGSDVGTDTVFIKVQEA